MKAVGSLLEGEMGSWFLLPALGAGSSPQPWQRSHFECMNVKLSFNYVTAAEAAVRNPQCSVKVVMNIEL